MSDLNLSAVPVTLLPRDELREGLGNLRADNTLSHPVERIQQHYTKQSRANDKHMMARIYGSHLPIRLHMEEKILTRFRRFPTLHSSHLGLETVLGVESDMEFGDYMNRAEESEKTSQLSAFEQMERRLGDKTDRG